MKNSRRNRMLQNRKQSAFNKLKMIYRKAVQLTRRMSDLMEIRRIWKETMVELEKIYPHLHNSEIGTQYFNAIQKRLADVEEEIKALDK